MEFEITKVPAIDATPLPKPEEKNEPSESIFGTTARTVARTGARALETAAGLPGDISEGVLGLLGAAEKGIFGTETIPKKVDVTFGKLGTLNKAIEFFTGEKSPLPETISPPTSDQIREYVSKPIGGKYLEPQAEWEKVSDAVVQDLVPLLVPVKGKVPFTRALKVSGLGNLASWATKKLGGGEKEGAIAKLGTTLLTTIVHPGTIAKFAKTLSPEAGKQFLKEVKESSRILNFMRKHTSKAVNPITGVLLGAYYGKGVPSALGIGVAYGVGTGEKILKTLAKNPELQKYYLATASAAAKQNAPLLAKNIKKLDKVVEKLAKKKEIDFGDFEITKL